MKHFNGRRLKAARRARGWSIPELVYQIRRHGVKLAEATIRNHEEGRQCNPRVLAVAAYAAALGLDPGAFFTKRGRKLQKSDPIPNN